MSFKVLLCFPLLLAICCCGPSEDDRLSMAEFKPNQSSPEIKFPQSHVQLSDTLTSSIKIASRISEIFKTERVIKLSTDPDAAFGEVMGIVVINDSMFILDGLDYRILKFGLDGRFEGAVGRKGQGPGEYQMPIRIKKCFGDNLAFYDASSNRVTVVDENGALIIQTPALMNERRFSAGLNFSWLRPERVFLSTYDTSSHTGTWHVICQVKNNVFSPVFGFGKRQDPFKKKNWGSAMWPIMEEVGETVWTGSPYDDKLIVFDREGRALAVLGDYPKKSGITPDELEDALARDDKEKAWNTFHKGTRMSRSLVVGDLVIVSLVYGSKGFYDIYDAHGNLLTKGLLSDRVLPLLAADGNYVYSGIIPHHDRRIYNDEDYEAMVEAGFDIHNFENDNPYIRVGKLAQ